MSTSIIIFGASGDLAQRKLIPALFSLFRKDRLPADVEIAPNVLTLCLQPDEGIHLRSQAKVPDTVADMHTVSLAFHYHDSFGANPIPEAYERLILDALHGDASLFTRGDRAELAWRLLDPILAAWQAGKAPLATYEPGSWGPAEADQLLTRDGRAWLHGCTHEEN